MKIPIQTSIPPIGGLTPPLIESSPKAPDVDFQSLLATSLSQTNQLEHQAQANIEGRLLGEDITSTEVYTSLRKAEMALKMMTQVRNKLIDAFQEIQQMRI